MKKKQIQNPLSLGKLGTSPLTGRFNSGFTLFELLVSISIIGILTALASVAFSGAQKKARDARRMEDVKLVQTAAEQFYSQSATYSYPTSNATPWNGSGGLSILSVFPTDPKNSGSYIYTYTYAAATNTYCFCALLENVTSGNSSNSSCNFTASSSYFCAKNQQ